MSNYDFLNLSYIEFEELSRDLLQKHFNVYLESFTQGRDKGIDLRYAKDKNELLIVQCKRYKDFKLLKTTLKEEYPKVVQLNPYRYVLTTTVGLTPNNKEEILKLFKGYIKSTSDIFGKDDLNNLLRIHSDVEKNHFKLWLSSVEVLNKLHNLDIIGRSEFEFKEILRNIKVYVQNESYSEAVDLLNKHNYVIISGIPGIGKTILARMLCFKYLSKGYELVAVSGDINEAEKVNPTGKKQVFYYDDFLGTNFLETSLNKNEDKRLIQFVEKISRSQSKRLIMTTREYILNQARQKFEILNGSKIDISKCIIDLSKYTKKVRAKILYNHLFFSSIPYVYIESLLNKKRYFHIINHPNYNPRLVEFMTDSNHIAGIEFEDYYDFFISNLNNPVDIWRHAFENQITDMSRYLLYSLILSGGYTSMEVLETTFENVIKLEERKYSLNPDRDAFKKSLKELENTFIKISKGLSKYIVQFQNPSIQDFLINDINLDSKKIKLLIDGAIYFNQLTAIFTTSRKHKENKIILNNKLANYLSKIIIKKYNAPSFLMKYFITRGDTLWHYSEYTLSDIDKLYEISELFDLENYPTLKQLVLKNLNDLIRKGSQFSNIGGYLSLLLRLNEEKKLLKKKAIISYLKNMKDIEAIEDLDKLEEYYPEEYEEVTDELGYVFRRYIENAINSHVDSLSELDKDAAEEIKSQIENLQSKYSVYVQHTISSLESKIEEKEQEESPNDLDDYKDDQEEIKNEEKYIEELFVSLKR